ncbi:MAG: Eco57I restriction-modification methylase domain-containing protein, partial [Methanophagales archaeon]|nr:Eco57I restriction-modification methylase domain-containing protein [Methanophagales archaeon]
EGVLPNLGGNIKCGNSLIGPDFYEQQQGTLFDEEGMRRVNVFDWSDEVKGFGGIMKRGGFDVVIGNPPYGALITNEEIGYLNGKFNLQQYSLDTYLLFVEKALLLLKDYTLLGMIFPNTWLLNLTMDKIRNHIFHETHVEEIVHYRHPVFPKATVDTEIVILRKGSPTLNHKISITIVQKDNSISQYEIFQRNWQKGEGKPVNVFERPEYEPLVDKLSHTTLLDHLCLITQGTKPFQVGKGKPHQTREIVNKKPFVSDTKKDDTFRPLLRGSLIDKWYIRWKNDYWISFGDWLAEPRYSANYDVPEKIVIRQTGDSLIATLDRKQFVVRDNLYTIVPRSNDIKLAYILGLLNSRVLNWYYQKIINPEQGEALAQVKRGHIAKLPIRTIDFSNPAEKAQHDKLVALVDNMLELQKKYHEARMDRDKEL